MTAASPTSAAPRSGARRGTGSRAFGSRLLGPVDQSVRSLRLRVQLLLTALLVTTNVLGAVAVFLISSFVIPGPAASGPTVLSLAIAVPVYVVVAVLIGASVGTSATLRALRWATQGREPSPEERRATLRAPVRLTLLQGGLWLAAALLFTVLALVLQPDRALTTGLTVTIAGLVVAALAYLFTQFTLRPISARALAGQSFSERPRGAGVGTRMVLFWCLGTGVPVVGLVVSAILALAGLEDSADKLPSVALVVGVTVLTVGLLVTVLNARAVVAPVISVRDALLDVQEGDFERSVPVYDGTELGLLQSGFNAMAEGLLEREHLRDMFGRHVGKEVAQAASSGKVELGGDTRVASVLFVDLVGSTTFATEHDAEEVVAMLNRFFGVVVDEVDRHHGMVNKFMGDAVLAVFGAPVDRSDHAGQALAAARTMARRLAEEVPDIGAGIGVSTGEVVAGNVGHQSRFEYTVIGDAVNSAARLTDLAKDVEGRVLVTRASVDAADQDEARHWAEHDEVRLRGRSEATPVAVLRDGGA